MLQLAETHYYVVYYHFGWEGDNLSWYILAIGVLLLVALLFRISAGLVRVVGRCFSVASMFLAMARVVLVYAVVMGLVEAVIRVGSIIDDVGVLFLVVLIVAALVPAGSARGLETMIVLMVTVARFCIIVRGATAEDRETAATRSNKIQFIGSWNVYVSAREYYTVGFVCVVVHGLLVSSVMRLQTMGMVRTAAHPSQCVHVKARCPAMCMLWSAYLSLCLPTCACLLATVHLLPVAPRACVLPAVGLGLGGRQEDA